MTEEPTGPETWTESFDDKLTRLRALVIEKQSRYGHDNINQGGVVGLQTRIGDKVARIKEAMDADRVRDMVMEVNDRFPAHFGAIDMNACLRDVPTLDETDESLDDTLMDLANYAIIWLMWRADEWNLPFSPSE